MQRFRTIWRRRKGQTANQFLNRVQVVPLTSRIDRLYPSESYVTLLGRKAKAMADQLSTVSKKRLVHRAGAANKEELIGVKRAITIQLDLPSGEQLH